MPQRARVKVELPRGHHGLGPRLGACDDLVDLLHARLGLPGEDRKGDTVIPRICLFESTYNMSIRVGRIVICSGMRITKINTKKKSKKSSFPDILVFFLFY